jgi:hypothetical protein
MGSLLKSVVVEPRVHVQSIGFFGDLKHEFRSMFLDLLGHCILHDIGFGIPVSDKPFLRGMLSKGRSALVVRKQYETYMCFVEAGESVSLFIVYKHVVEMTL